MFTLGVFPAIGFKAFSEDEYQVYSGEGILKA
jgi:hypothetical protein